MHQPVSPMHLPVSSHPTPNHALGSLYGRQQQQQHEYPSSQQSKHPQSSSSTTTVSTPLSTPHSASERVAFNIYPGGAQLPGLTLGPSGVPIEDTASSSAVSTSAEIGRGCSNSTQPSQAHGGTSCPTSFGSGAHVGPGGGGGLGSGFAHMQILDQDISPLTSPWLGAASHPTGNASGCSSQRQPDTTHTSRGMSAGMGLSCGSGNKRTASESGDEGRGARKKQSPAIRPVLRMTIGSVSGTEKEENVNRDRGRSRSPVGGRDSNGSMNPTNVISPRMTMENALRKSSAGPPVVENTSSGMTTGTRKSRRSSKSTPLSRSTPSNVLGAITSLTRSKSRAHAVGTPSMTGGETVQDSPSPMDLNLDIHDNRTMPPPPLPASAGVGANGNMNVGLSENPTDRAFANSNNGTIGMNDMSFDRMMGLDGMGGGMNGMGDMDLGGINMSDMGMDAMGAMDMGEMGPFGSGPMGILDMNFAGPSAQGQGEHGEEQIQLPPSGHVGTTKKNQQQQPTMPVATPRSVLNLGKLGSARLGSASSSGEALPVPLSGSGVMTRAQKNSKLASNAVKDAKGAKLAKRSSVASPGLKSIRPGEANACFL